MNEQEVHLRLGAAFAVDPPQGFAVVDERLRRTMGETSTTRMPLRYRGIRLALGLAAAFVLLAGVTAGAITVLDRLAGATPGTQVAWDQGVEIGQRQVVGDLAVTVARGFVDTNRVVLGVTVERADPESSAAVSGLELELRDPAGTRLPAGPVPDFGTFDEAGRIDQLLTFAPTTRADGAYTLRVGLTPVAGHAEAVLVFRFELPPPVGTVVEVDEEQAVGGTTVRAGTIRIGPSAVTANLEIDPAERDVSDWTAFGWFRHGDTMIPIDWGTYGATGLDLIAGTYAGTDDAAGRWTMTLTELVGDRRDGSQVRLQGPWDFSFEVAPGSGSAEGQVGQP